MSALCEWLAGEWTVRRTINHGAGTFRGLAAFAQDGAGGLTWTERGHLRLGAHDGPASRTLRILPGPGEAVRVTFADGRPFHTLALPDGRDTAEHVCGDDVYRGAFDRRGPDALRITWRVEGPRKADVIQSDYRRMGSCTR